MPLAGKGGDIDHTLRSETLATARKKGRSHEAKICIPCANRGLAADRNKSTIQPFSWRNANMSSSQLRFNYVGQLLNWTETLYSASKIDFDVGKRCHKKFIYLDRS